MSLAVGLAILADRVPRWAVALVVTGLAVVNWALVSLEGAVRPADLGRVLGRLALLPSLGRWSPVMVMWVAGLVALAGAPVAWSRLHPRAPGFRLVAATGLAASVVVAGAVGVAAANTTARFDVPQRRGGRTRSVSATRAPAHVAAGHRGRAG